MTNEELLQRPKPYEKQFMDDEDYFEAKYGLDVEDDDMYEDKLLGRTTEGVDPNSFLGMANQSYAPLQEQEQPMSQQDQYIQRLQAVSEKYGPYAGKDMSRADIVREKVEPSDLSDRIWNTLGIMGSFLVMTGGSPAGMALAGFKYFTDDKARENRYNQIDELVADGYSDRTIRQYIDTGDDRYLAEDTRARAAVEQKQYERGIDVRNFEEDVRRSDRSYDFDVEKFGEEKRKNLESEKIARWQTSINEKTMLWNTNEKRLDKLETDKFGNMRLFDKMGNLLKAYNAAGQEVDGKKVKLSGGYGDSSMVDASKLPPGWLMLNGQPQVNEQNPRTGEWYLRAPKQNEIKEFKLSDDYMEAIDKFSVGRELVDPFINGEKEIPTMLYGESAILTGDRPILSKQRAQWEGNEAEKLYAYTELMDAEGGIKGVEEARNAGASGINTEKEFERFKKGFPKLRSTSKEAFKDSLRLQRDYVQRWNEREAAKQQKWTNVSIDEDGKITYDKQNWGGKRTELQQKSDEKLGIPPIGFIDEGMEFLGGDPNNQRNWRPVKK